MVQQAPVVEVIRNGQKALTKYTPETHKKILENIKEGVSVTDAGLLAGLGTDTLFTWMEKGRRRADEYPEFAKLVADIEVAKAERRAQAVKNIVTVGNSQQAGTWQANAWYLERTDPENWGRKDKVEHVGNESPQTQINTVVLIDADARETARDLLSRVAGSAGEHKPIGPGSGVQLENGDS